MVTLLRVYLKDGTVCQCDIRCHNAWGRECDCCCGGRYHGKREGSWPFVRAVQEHQERILTDLSLHEEAGELWIVAFRKDLTSRLFTRRPWMPIGYPRLPSEE